MKKNTTDKTETKLVRLNKFLADSGVASRRKADELIKDGYVKINNKPVSELGLQVDPENDIVRVKNRIIKANLQKFYILFNKPTQVITSMSDPEGRKSVADYFPKLKMRIFPVGRLDWDSEGLLLLTNDGDWAQKVIHPSSDVLKTYHVKVKGTPSFEKVKKLEHGVSIIGGRVKAHRVEPLDSKRMFKGGKGTKYQWFKIIIAEGKNRQVRKMFEKINCDVIKLQRVAIGSLKLGKLKPGGFRVLKPSETLKIFSPPKEPLKIKSKSATTSSSTTTASNSKSKTSSSRGKTSTSRTKATSTRSKTTGISRRKTAAAKGKPAGTTRRKPTTARKKLKK